MSTRYIKTTLFHLYATQTSGRMHNVLQSDSLFNRELYLTVSRA